MPPFAKSAPPPAAAREALYRPAASGALFWEFLRIGWSVLSIHKFRSALTVSSIAIGTFSIVVMSSLVTSGTTTLVRGLEDIGGARMVLLLPKSPEKTEKKRASYAHGLYLADEIALRGRVPHLRHVGILARMGSPEATRGSMPPMRVDLIGATAEFLPMFRMNLSGGRGLNAEDVAGSRRVAVIGQKVATTLFGTDAKAIGQNFRVGDEYYRVVGVVQEVKRLAKLAFDWNEFVAVPVTTFGPRTIGPILMVMDEPRHNDLARRVAGAVLDARHDGVDDFKIFDFSQMMGKLQFIFALAHLLAGLISSVALIAGGIGIMNILLVSVSERVREIGIRKAMGASDLAIRRQFLFESALLSFLGGTFGAALGCVATIAAGPLIRWKAGDWVTALSFGGIVAALVASILLGVFFGLVPARKAGRLQVVECLTATG